MKQTKAERNDDIKRRNAEATLHALVIVEDITTGLRIEKCHVKRWMLENKTIIRGGTVYHLAFKYLGEGVYKMKLRPVEFKETVIVKEFEPHKIPNETPGGLPTFKY